MSIDYRSRRKVMGTTPESIANEMEKLSLSTLKNIDAISQE
jgi:hypothetical protein